MKIIDLHKVKGMILIISILLSACVATGRHMITQDYGWSDRFQQWHRAIDVGGYTGETVISSSFGTVVDSYYDNLQGGTVIVEHTVKYEQKYIPQSGSNSGRPITISRTLFMGYIHLDEELYVKRGDEVDYGTPLGTIGDYKKIKSSYGPHVHFGIAFDASNMSSSLNPHKFWVNGPGKITCYDPSGHYGKETIEIVMPLLCK